MLGRRCKKSVEHRTVTVPGRFYAVKTNLHVQWCIHNKKHVKIGTIKADSVMKVKNTLAQDSKYLNNTCSLHVIHTGLLKRNIYYCIYVSGLQK